MDFRGGGEERIEVLDVEWGAKESYRNGGRLMSVLL